jgi:gliding motility-associated lipoprotein GldH
MRLGAGTVLLLIAIAFAGCGDGKVYQKYTDFEQQYWLVSDTARFEFTIPDTASKYNIYCNIRNSTQYPYSRIFVNFSLEDSTGRSFHKALLNDFLFDPKSGKPLGKTGLGDLYDHQLSVLTNYKFSGEGPYMVSLDQLMRTDTLSGVISVGIGVEKVSAD